MEQASSEIEPEIETANETFEATPTLPGPPQMLEESADNVQPEQIIEPMEVEIPSIPPTQPEISEDNQPTPVEMDALPLEANEIVQEEEQEQIMQQSAEEQQQPVEVLVEEVIVEENIPTPPEALLEENMPHNTLPQPTQEQIEAAKPIRNVLSRLLGRGREQISNHAEPPPSYNDPAFYTWEDPNRTPSPPPVRPSSYTRNMFPPFNQHSYHQQPPWGYPPMRKRRKNKPKKSQKVDPSLPHRKSKYRGVYWERRDQKWRARAYCIGKRYSAGSYTVEREAALAVNRLCRKLGVPLQNPHLEAIVLDDYEAPPIKPYRPRKKKRSNIFEGAYPPVKREYNAYGVKSEYNFDPVADELDALDGF